MTVIKGCGESTATGEDMGIGCQQTTLLWIGCPFVQHAYSHDRFTGRKKHITMLMVKISNFCSRSSMKMIVIRYFVVFTIDTVIGVLLTILLHRLVLYLLKIHISRRYVRIPSDADQSKPKTWAEYIVQCGDYGDPPSLRAWTPQMIEWVRHCKKCYCTQIAESRCW